MYYRNNIEPKHIYYVTFDPVKGNEFSGKHLALVLKLNKDNRTAVVLPLTSSPQGVGGNKKSLDYILSLPSNLRETETYAILDQIRTVDFKRFTQAKDKGKFITPIVENKLFKKIWIIILEEGLYNVPEDDKIHIYEKLYSKALVTKVQNLAYGIIKEKKVATPDMRKISSIENEIIEIINKVPYGAWENHISADAVEIIHEILKKNK